MWLVLVALAHALSFSEWSAAQRVAPHPESAYHFAPELFAEAAELVSAHPGLVQAEEIGRSVEDRPIWAFRVAEPGRPVTARMLVFANIHALEWVPSEVALAFLHEVVRHPPPGVAVTVILSLNPDGRARVEEDLIAGRNLFRRGNANKVDLNRDFAVNRDPPAVWKHLSVRPWGSSPGPLSQPESRALDALAARERHDVAVSLHAFGGFVFYPWAGSWKRPEDWAALHALATVAAAGMTRHPYRPRQLSRYLFTFRGVGMEIDHLYGQYGTAALLVETTRSGLSPLRPWEWTTHFRWYNPHDPEPHARECAQMLRALAWHIATGDAPTPLPMSKR
jgi:carboxypeptidase T